MSDPLENTYLFYLSRYLPIVTQYYLKAKVPTHNFTSTVSIKLPQRSFYSKFAGISGNLQAWTTLVYIQHSQLPSTRLTVPAMLCASLVCKLGPTCPRHDCLKSMQMTAHPLRAFLLAAQCLQAPARSWSSCISNSQQISL